MTSQSVIDLVRRGLAACQPCRAREISKFIRSCCGVEIDVHTVNQVLYRVLWAEVVQSEESYEWSFKIGRLNELVPQDAVGSTEFVVSEQDKAVAAQEDTADSGLTRAQRLRTLQRLRSGLPPTDGLQDLSVGYGEVIPLVEHRLNGRGGANRWIMAKGDYGAGKTHLLQTIRCIAHAHNFATCYLCADSSMNALNHPQRFVTGLLGTLEAPGRVVPGYENVILDMAARPEGRSTLWDLCRKWSVGGRMPFPQAVGRLWSLDSMDQACVGTPEARWTMGMLADDLCGINMLHRGATESVRQMVYHLLLFARDVLMSLGYQGLVVLIDEAESIFTKLPTVRSRMGALKVLSAFCVSRPFEQIMTAVAITPDAHSLLLLETPDMRFKSYECLKEFEPVGTLLHEFSNGSRHVVDCHAVRGNEVPILLQKVRRFYLATYPDWLWGAPQEHVWGRFISEVKSLDLPNRLLIRHTVDLLDAQRYGTASRP